MKSKILIFFIILINHINTFAFDKTYSKYFEEQRAQRKQHKKSVSFYEENPKCLICNKKIEYEYLGHDLAKHVSFYNKSLTTHAYQKALEESYNIERYISFIIIDSYLKSSILEVQQMLNIKEILSATRAALIGLLS